VALQLTISGPAGRVADADCVRYSSGPWYAASFVAGVRRVASWRRLEGGPSVNPQLAHATIEELPRTGIYAPVARGWRDRTIVDAAAKEGAPGIAILVANEPEVAE
jgi:hypothetical protein